MGDTYGNRTRLTGVAVQCLSQSTNVSPKQYVLISAGNSFNVQPDLTQVGIVLTQERVEELLAEMKEITDKYNVINTQYNFK